MKHIIFVMNMKAEKKSALKEKSELVKYERKNLKAPKVEVKYNLCLTTTFKKLRNKLVY